MGSVSRDIRVAIFAISNSIEESLKDYPAGIALKQKALFLT
jgi:hypothetical protein